ncbi:hypothetical protein RHGRI_032307 [Rhododendron griersonianum]|uniref:Uncharacterized protein n=1 Tax=Rhododendron griersonianum TaxID=479676 RepID=A0AAV6IBF3_9ERIC|nr:hypothetical protein RHGRI_032307 [Rhododendron griersonianum]
MLCLPFFSDQLTYCRYAFTEWGIGMKIHRDVKREEVEKLVRELMEGKKGKWMKNKAMECWKNYPVIAANSELSAKPPQMLKTLRVTTMSLS